MKSIKRIRLAGMLTAFIAALALSLCAMAESEGNKCSMQGMQQMGCCGMCCRMGQGQQTPDECPEQNQQTEDRMLHGNGNGNRVRCRRSMNRYRMNPWQNDQISDERAPWGNSTDTEFYGRRKMDGDRMNPWRKGQKQEEQPSWDDSSDNESSRGRRMSGYRMNPWLNDQPSDERTPWGNRMSPRRNEQKQEEHPSWDGSSDTEFRSRREMNGNRMNPWRDRQNPDEWTPLDENSTDAESGATSKQPPEVLGRRGGYPNSYGRIDTKELVEQGIIDQEKADQIDSYFEELMAKSRIDMLLEDGVIDQETADRINGYKESLEQRAPFDEENPVEDELPPEKTESIDPAYALPEEQNMSPERQPDAADATGTAQPDAEQGPD